MSAKRIQRKRTKGWRMPEGAIYVGRPTVFGNPFAPTVIPGWATMSREYAVQDFTTWLNSPRDGSFFWRNVNGGFQSREESQAALAKLDARLPDLRGKDLACWCPIDQPCHADVLLELANGSAS